MRIGLLGRVITYQLFAISTAMAEPISAPDDAISRVEDCVCYRSIEAQNLAPWEIAWTDPEKLKKQISHCVCKAQIDIQAVKDPKRYLVPGTVVK